MVVTFFLMTLKNWVNRKAPNSIDLILQMDIEGSEYDVLLASGRDLLLSFRIIVIEFHGLHRLLEVSGYRSIYKSFQKLLKDFDVVHIHPNNICPNSVAIYKGFEVPSVMEFTLLRKDRISFRNYINMFPHVLDRCNVFNNPEINLPECWYRGAYSVRYRSPIPL